MSKYLDGDDRSRMRFEQLAHRKPRSIPAGGGRLFRFANSHFAGKRIIRHLGMDCRGEWNGRYFLRPGGWPDRADRHTTVVHRDDELHQDTIPRVSVSANSAVTISFTSSSGRQWINIDDIEVVSSAPNDPQISSDN
ncbi:hypothetical protein [Burkholderia pseudomallei]|uniref:hypothetical protein n=1 Tax=Burkholderia pseudomallei TaxID=28450 RepID=UPI0011789BDE|nr:hypothetical protein [Burkholderia pseudomallei]